MMPRLLPLMMMMLMMMLMTVMVMMTMAMLPAVSIMVNMMGPPMTVLLGRFVGVQASSSRDAVRCGSCVV